MGTNRETTAPDLTDAEWAVLGPLIPPARPGGRPRDVDMRAILAAAFYVDGRGGGWRRLPPDFPPWQTVYGYVRAWKRDGTWERMQAALREGARSGTVGEVTVSAALRDHAAVLTHRARAGTGGSQATLASPGSPLQPLPAA